MSTPIGGHNTVARASTPLDSTKPSFDSKKALATLGKNMPTLKSMLSTWATTFENQVKTEFKSAINDVNTFTKQIETTANKVSNKVVQSTPQELKTAAKFTGKAAKTVGKFLKNAAKELLYNHVNTTAKSIKTAYNVTKAVNSTPEQLDSAIDEASKEVTNQETGFKTCADDLNDLVKGAVDKDGNLDKDAIKDAIKNAPKDKVADMKKAYNEFKASKKELNEAKEKHIELKNIKTMDPVQRTLYANDKRLNAVKNVGTSLWITGSVIGMAFPPAGGAIAALGGAVFLGSTAVKAVNNMSRSAYSASIPSGLKQNLQTQIQEFTSKNGDTKELNNKLNDLFSKQDFEGIKDLVGGQMDDIKKDLQSIQDTCQSIKEQVPVAQQEVVNGAIGALTDAISFVSFAFTFYGIAEAGAHLTSSNASSIGGESMKEAFSAESIKNQLDPMTLISNFKDINIGHALQEGSKEGLKELAEHAKDVAIHHTLMDGLDTFSEANEEAINETVSNLFFSNSATEAAQLSTGE